jgi:hypothetical protein
MRCALPQQLRQRRRLLHPHVRRRPPRTRLPRPQKPRPLRSRPRRSRPRRSRPRPHNPRPRRLRPRAPANPTPRHRRRSPTCHPPRRRTQPARRTWRRPRALRLRGTSGRTTACRCVSESSMARARQRATSRTMFATRRARATARGTSARTDCVRRRRAGSRRKRRARARARMPARVRVSAYACARGGSVRLPSSLACCEPPAYIATTYAPCCSNGARISVAQPSISGASASATAPVCS